MVAAGKKLLVLDVNGLLLDTYFQAEQRPDRPHDAKVNRFYVYKRNGCEDFVQFCLENFVVGVWSSAREYNVLSLVEFMFKESMGKLAFVWHQEHCTDTKLKHPENKHKPVFLKELSKLWDKCDPTLPWEKGDFGPSNTVLIDDSPYKALRNPPNTGIFPQSYKATAPGDSYLVDELRKYLEGLVRATDVQVYISQNPFGVPGLAHGDEHFEFFSSALINAETPVTHESLPAPSEQEEKVVAVVNPSSGDIVVALPDSDTFAASHRRRGKTKFGSTVEESLEYRGTSHIQSPRDFAERLSRTAEASGEVARERYPSGDADPAVPEGVPRRQPWSQRKSSSRGTSYERDSDRHQTRRGDGLRDGADARHSPRSRKRVPVTAADRHGGEAGYESYHISKRRNPGNGSQWVDTQAQYPRETYAVDTTIPGRWQERAREWDPPVLDTRLHLPRANLTAWVRPGLSPVSGTYREARSIGWGLGRAVNPLEDHIKVGWAGESRSPGRHRNHEGQLRDRYADRGKPKDRDSVHVEPLRDPYTSLRGGPRVDEDFHSARIRGHQDIGRAGVRDQEDVDRSARPSFSRGDGYTRGGSTEYGGHDWSSERGRGRPRHQGEVHHGYSRHSQVYDSRAGAGSSNPYGEYDTIKRSSKVPRRYDERSEDISERDRPRTWGGVGTFDSGRTELHVRRENPVGAAISGRMSGWQYEQAHSRPRNWNKWER